MHWTPLRSCSAASHLVSSQTDPAWALKSVLWYERQYSKWSRLGDSFQKHTHDPNYNITAQCTDTGRSFKRESNGKTSWWLQWPQNVTEVCLEKKASPAMWERMNGRSERLLRGKWIVIAKPQGEAPRGFIFSCYFLLQNRYTKEIPNWKAGCLES